MAQPEDIAPVKLFVGCMFKDEHLLSRVKNDLEDALGKIDYESEIFPFDTHTSYYENEMGENLKKIFYSFKDVIDPSNLPHAKNKSFELENKYKTRTGRQINIDPGYIDFNKVILASFKYGSQKIYLGKKVWADLTLFYEKGRFKRLPWSFPDFREDRYYNTLLKIRELLKKDWRK